MRVMDNSRLPDVNRLRATKDRLSELPDQERAVDTSNWENRDVLAPYLDTKKKKVVDRKIDFIKPDHTVDEIEP